MTFEHNQNRGDRFKYILKIKNIYISCHIVLSKDIERKIISVSSKIYKAT